MYENVKGEWIADLGNGKYKNPILFSDYSDPDVIRVGNDFFMVASSFTYFPGVPVLQSTDLINWKLISYAVEKMPLDKYSVPCHGMGVWAPSIRYHDNKFWVYFGDPDEGIFMTNTENPFGKWNDTVCVAKSKGWIDTCPFWDDDGNAYLIRGVAKSRIGYKSKLFLHKMSTDGTKLLDDGLLVFDGRINHPTIEGPKIYKRNGYYYIFAPAGGVQTGWQMVARSKNIYGPYEHKVVMWQGNSPINGPHQGGLIDMDNGESWFIHFQDLEGYGRVTHLQPAKWTDDNWIEIGVDTNNDHIGEPVLKYNKPANCKSDIIAPIDSDDFKSDKLNLQWQWQAYPKDSFYKMTGNSIRLYALPYSGKNISQAANVLCELMTRPNFQVTAKVNMNLSENDSCGLVITGGSYCGLRVENGTIKQVCFELAKDKFTYEVVKFEKKLKTKSIYLRLQVSYICNINCFVSTDGINYEKIGDTLKYEVSRKSWVGGKIGIFAVNNNGKNNGGYADFEYIKVD